MSDNATQYADSIAADIVARTEAGSPFGWTHADTEEWTGDLPEGWTTDPESPWQEASAYDYLSDVLDIAYTVGSDAEYRSARILIAWGGPTAWIDTRTNTLEVAWWIALVFRKLPSAFIDGLDEALSELWESR